MSQKKQKRTKKLPSLLQECKELFNTSNLYEVINIRHEATAQEIKKGYHKTSLAVHPDRVSHEDKVTATRKFQTLGKVYTILSDKDKRAVYDETGDVGDNNVTIDQERDWCEYWRLLFPKVTIQDIKDFEKKYKGSDEEKEDLKAAYLEAKGNMNVIMGSVLCCTSEDEPRFCAILNDLINNGTLPNFKAFTKEPRKKKLTRQKKATQEAKEAEIEAKKLKLDSDNALVTIIQKRGESRAAEATNFFANLEAKYAKPPNKKRSRSSKK